MNLHPRTGSEQRGHRPAVIVSHDVFNVHPRWNSLIVVPMSTSQRQLRNQGSSVRIEAGESGLRRTSVALCHQVTTIDRSKVGQPVGMLSLAALQRVEDGLRAALDLLP